MNPKVINPYSKAGAAHKNSLDYLIANLPVNPTFDDLNDKLAESFYLPDPADPNMTDLAVPVIKTVLPNVYNGFVNGMAADSIPRRDGICSGYWRYNETQMALIRQMLSGINNIPVESIGEFLGSMEEEMVSGRLTYEEQMPLLIAAATGKADYEYWMAQITTPGTWAPYLNADHAINYLHAAGWVNAAMQGALLAYGLMKHPQVQPLDAFTATIGSVGLAAGKVMFGWIPVGRLNG